MASVRSLAPAISEDRSEKAPARFDELAADCHAASTDDVRVLRQVTVPDKDEERFATKMVDPNRIASTGMASSLVERGRRQAALATIRAGDDT
ncbi:hypothetical protein [Xaviernesmea oryzae]|uniref:hypothetical protein n=1 Tax=Xaviernesmea oryzae TaxID=464029 RepID=UPI000B005AF7|nr:hypothetical protein [Xaviernesmea oryzae]